jgi:hypothetical protein
MSQSKCNFGYEEGAAVRLQRAWNKSRFDFVVCIQPNENRELECRDCTFDGWQWDGIRYDMTSWSGRCKMLWFWNPFEWFIRMSGSLGVWMKGLTTLTGIQRLRQYWVDFLKAQENSRLLTTEGLPVYSMSSVSRLFWEAKNQKTLPASLRLVGQIDKLWSDKIWLDWRVFLCLMIIESGTEVTQDLRLSSCD